MSQRSVLGLGLLACAAALLLYIRPLCFAMLSQDDFPILARSWTWQKTLDGLWVPNNEHAMPLGRLLTYGLIVLCGGRPTALPLAAVLLGPLAQLFGMVLVYHFVRRELGQPLHGLLAMIFFGVSTVYQQAIFWFAASFAVLALDTLLLALLAAQRWRQTGRGLYLIPLILCCLLAPAWFASGILAGPLCFLYLFPLSGGRKKDMEELPSPLRPRLAALLPLLGTGLFLAMSLPRTAETILHTEHYGGKTAAESFHPDVGLQYTCRSVVDNLLLGVVGVSTISLPVGLVFPLLGALSVALGWIGWHTTTRRLFLLGVALVGTSYLLIYSARAEWEYAIMTESGWSRYHLQPQLGLAFILAAALSLRSGSWRRLDSAGLPPRRQVVGIALLIGVCFAIQLPRGLLSYYPYDPQQHAVLRQIEAVDARCRECHIDAETARQALPKLDLQTWASDINGWDFLRGSATPRPHTVSEVRHLLREWTD